LNFNLSAQIGGNIVRKLLISQDPTILLPTSNYKNRCNDSA